MATTPTIRTAKISLPSFPNEISEQQLDTTTTSLSQLIKRKSSPSPAFHTAVTPVDLNLGAAGLSRKYSYFG